MPKLENILEKSFEEIRYEVGKIKSERDEALKKVAEWNKDEEIQKL